MDLATVYSTQEAAQKIGVTDAYVRQLIADGKIKAKRLGKKQWVIPDSEVDRFQSQDRDPKKGGRPRISD